MTIQVDRDQARLFLKALGKNGNTRMRGFFPSGHPLKATDHGKKAVATSDTALQWQQEGRGVYIVINDGGDTDAAITGCRAIFCEWDDRPVDWQITAWQDLNLPEPSLMVSTGGKSIHCYWIFNDPITVEQWRDLQVRLLEYADADRTLKNPSRVMRLPGAWHLAPDGTPNGKTEIIHTSEHRYTPEQFDQLLPSIEAVEQAAADQEHVKRFPIPTALRPRTLAEIQAALDHIPPAVPKQGQYTFFRNLLWGLIRACEEVGHTADDALHLMQQHSPLFAEAPQVAASPFTSIKAGTFWYHAQKNGYKLSKQPAASSRGGGFQSPKEEKKKSPQRRLSHARRMECFNRCVEIQALHQRNSLRRRARLLKAAKDLEINSFINRQEIAQLVLEAKDRQQGHCFAVLTAQDRAAMKQPVIRWVIPSLVPEGDLTIIGGRPKVGKTRLAVAMAASVLNGTDCIGFGQPDTRSVLLVTDDQADADTCTMLQALKVWDHPNLLWSRHFRFQENDLDALLDALRLNPGALVIIDSLRSISRSLQYGENDPEIGAALYDLKQAVIDSGSTLALIHHCNKSADLVGTEALSGHNAIAGAANTVITLHYCPDAAGKPDKSNPQRRMVREARTGEGCDLVIDRGAGPGTYRQVSDFHVWQQQLDQAKKTQKELDQLDKLTKDQQEVLDVITENENLTIRQVTFNWKDAEPTQYQIKNCRRVVDSLKKKELVSERPTKGGAVFTRKKRPPTPDTENLGFLGSPQSGTEVSMGPPIGSDGVFGVCISMDLDESEASSEHQTQPDPLQRKERPQKPICPDPTRSLAAQGETPKTPSRGVSREEVFSPPPADHGFGPQLDDFLASSHDPLDF